VSIDATIPQMNHLPRKWFDLENLVSNGHSLGAGLWQVSLKSLHKGGLQKYYRVTQKKIVDFAT